MAFLSHGSVDADAENTLHLVVQHGNNSVSNIFKMFPFECVTSQKLNVEKYTISRRSRGNGNMSGLILTGTFETM